MYINYAITSDGKKSPVVSSTDFINGVPASEYALKSAFAYNLLDNSDFRKPMNQRGKTAYSVQSVEYTLDRWEMTTAAAPNSNMELKSDGSVWYIALSAAYGHFFQKIRDFSRYKGKTLTLAMECHSYASDNGLILLINTGITQEAVSITKGLNVVSCFIPEEATQIAVGVQNNSADTIVAFYPTWVALYEGSYTQENIPPYVPKGYTIEALNCGVPMQPHNLLDNSYFINPVNQRGQSSYTAADYTIDRWALKEGAGTSGINISDNGITINKTTSLIVFRQSLEERVSNYLIGKKVTAAAKSSDGTIITVTTTVPPSGETLDTGEAFFNNGLGMDIYRHSTRSDLQVRFLAGETIAPITLEWVALYEGEYTAETLPPYIPKGYMTELAECQRYYYKFQNGTNVYGYSGSSGTSIYIAFELPTIMRLTNPTVSMSSNIYGAFGGAGATSLTSISSSKTMGKQFELVMSSPNTLSPNTVYAGWVNGTITVSADLS